MFGALHLVALGLRLLLFGMFLRSETVEAGSPDEDEGGGGGGSDRLTTPPSRPPAGSAHQTRSRPPCACAAAGA